MKKVFCVNPFIQFSHTADGFYRACCVAKVDRKKELHTSEMDLLEYFNSDQMKSLRQDMITGDFSDQTKDTCRQCIYNANKNIDNKRTNDNDRYLSNEMVQEAIQFVEDNPEADLDPKYLQYVNFKSLGNLCNLKCIMCSPTASSKIFAELKQLEPKKYKDHNAIMNPYDEHTKDRYLKDLDKIFSSISKFTLVGGESMIHPDFPELYEMFYKNKNAKNIELQVTSNGTVLPDYVLEHAHKFKRLHLSMSVDGVGDRGSYIRSGLDWNIWDRNVKKALSSDASVGFGIAFQLLNVGYLDEIYEYMLDLGAENKIYYGGLVTWPTYLRATNLPNSLKKQYLEKIKKSPVYNVPDAKSIINILKNEQDSPKDFMLGMKKLKEQDQIRGTNLLNHFPEFEKYYNLQLKHHLHT
jgi:hypothetical protein